MRVEQKTVMVPTVVSEIFADDGTPFKTTIECQQYEHKLKSDDLSEILKNIPSIEYCPDFAWDDYGYTWYYVQNENDVSLILEYYNHHGSCDDFTTEIGEFPQWICMEDIHGEYYYHGTLEGYLRRVRELEDTLVTCLVCGGEREGGGKKNESP